MTLQDDGREPTLRIRDLTIASPLTELVHGITFDIAPGERVGLIGESGSGKSLTATSIMGLLPDSLDTAGEMRFAGVPGNLLNASEKSYAALRGAAMTTVFQEPMTALNPLMKVGRQVEEVLVRHGSVPRGRPAAARAVELLAEVRLPNPNEAADAYPHQLSGGQRQRVMIAIAMANSPRLLICDEPTTALDVTVQAEMLRLIRRLVSETGTSLLFITHDIGVVAATCERLLVMYQGNIVEDGPVEQILSAPTHPYTQALIAASDLRNVDASGRLRTIHSGEPATAVAQQPAATPSRIVREMPHEVYSGNSDTIFNEIDGEALIRVRNLTRTYRGRGRGSLFKKPPVVHGLRGLNFDIAQGQRFGIVGESGSGKSTLLRQLCALDEPTTGSITVAGEEIVGARESQLQQFRSQVQIVFQDPMGSLDPRMRIGDIVAEPLHGVSRDEARNRVLSQLQSVGLDPDVANRHPHQFSGGQRQRISIARALVTRPKILIADEAVSALDVSVRAQVLNLLSDLVDEYALTLLFVSHDLGVIRHSCDAVAVLSEGRIVECGPTESVYKAPQHPYTQELIRATPTLQGLQEINA